MRDSRWISRALVALAAGTLTLTMAATVAASSPPPHAGRPLGATLTGAAEVPPADADGAGAATIWVNYGQRRVCWQLSASNIILPATAAHIHVGAVGVAGPIVVPLSAPDATGKAHGCTPVTRALAKNLIQHPDRYYVNVHTTDFPGGAIRGQLHKGHGAAPAAAVTGLKIVKVVDGNTTGWAGGTFVFTVTCGAVVMTPSIPLGSGVTTGSTTLHGLTAGTSCTVVEAPTTPPGANASWIGTAYNPVTPVTIVAGSVVTVTVTDTRFVTPGSLMITKSIVGNSADWLGGTFNFTVTCGASVTPAGITLGPGIFSGSVLVSGLTAGASCTLAEAPTTPPGVGHTWSSTAYAPAATTIIPAASTVGITVTNTRT